MMMNHEPVPPETDALVLNLRALVERISDPAGSAERAARLDATIAEALDLIERLSGVLKGIDLQGLTNAVNLGRDLVAVQGNLVILRAETKARAESAAQLKIEVVKRLEALKEIGGA